MKRTEYRISPAAYDCLQRELLEAELQGYGPTECAAMAMTAIGIGPLRWPPQEPVETVLIVDPTLDGPVYPFMEWPAELAAAR